MKFLVVLAVTLAVASAAFTGSLVQQTQPLLRGIRNEFSSNIVGRSSADVGLRGAFLDGITSHLSGVISEIESTVNGLEAAALNVAGEIQAAVGQIQALIENLAGSAQGAAASLIESIQAALGGLLAGSFGARTLDFDAVFNQLQALLATINLPETLQVVIVEIFGPVLGGHILHHLSLSHRGWWDNIWGGVTDTWNDVIGQIENLGQQIGDLAEDTWSSIEEKFNRVKEVVMTFIAGGWQYAQNVGFPAAQQLLWQMVPYICQLGPMAANAASTLISAHTGLTIPPGFLLTAAGIVIPGDHC